MIEPATDKRRGLVATLLVTFRDTFRFSGRATRREFIIYVAFTLIVTIGGLLITTPGYPYGRALTFLVAIPGPALTLRRLQDANWPGALLLVSLLPFIGFVLTIALCLHRSQAETRRHATTALKAIAVVLIGITLLPLRYEPYFIPSGSMKPTLLQGDYVFADLWSYGPPCPICAGNRLWLSQPAHGDIVTFTHPVNQTDFVKRIIGLPGDSIRMVDGIVFVNGTPLIQTPDGTYTETFERHPVYGTLPACANLPKMGGTCEQAQLREKWPDGSGYNVLDRGPVPLDTTSTFTVPEEHLFFLGDNRDNSMDSRISQSSGGIGFVPMTNVKGRMTRVVFSSTNKLYDPRAWRMGRYWIRLE